MKLYGNLTNRFEENKNYNKDKQIHVGDDITKYHYSDRTCYYVTEVLSQKHIKVKKYYVCADHSKPGGLGRQNWLYFKTRAEYNKYINSVFKDRDLDENVKDDSPIELVYRYNKWMLKDTYTPKDLDSENMFGNKLRDVFFTNKEVKKLEEGKNISRYYNFGNISFGVKDYYYDYEF